MNISVSLVTWLPCWRIIPSRFPPIDLFERVAAPADREAIVALETLTNDRIRDAVGELQLVPQQDRISGRGTSHIMAAFTHLNPAGSRFSDGTFGVFYAAYTLDTAIAETLYHREQFLRATSELPLELDMRVLLADLQQHLHDIRGGSRICLPSMCLRTIALPKPWESACGRRTPGELFMTVYVMQGESGPPCFGSDTELPPGAASLLCLGRHTH